MAKTLDKDRPMKIKTIYLPEIQVNFIEGMEKSGLVASKSEFIRQCINIAMPYFHNLMKSYTILDDNTINRIRMVQNALITKRASDLNIAEEKERSLMSTYGPSKKRGPGASEGKKIPLGNPYWRKVFENGKWVDVPIDIPLEEVVGGKE